MFIFLLILPKLSF